MSRVHVIYHHFPHYRAPVMRELARSQENDYHYFGAIEDIEGIRGFCGDETVSINPIGLKIGKSGHISLSSYDAVFANNPDAIIIIGNPNIRATWVIAIRARIRGIKVAFWSHGWLRPEPPVKARIRNLYFSLANRVFVYGSRAVSLAENSGFPANKIDVIWNSLDWELQSKKFSERTAIPIAQLRGSLGLPATALIATTLSRVTEICRYDLLIEAAAILNKRLPGPVVVNMIGTGPSLEDIKAYARKLGVDLLCAGAIYDEDTLADHLLASDMVVSPGKVGLTAMHSLAYGVPTITHNDLDRQMPEVEAILEGKTGAFFPYGSSAGLASAIELLAGQNLPISDRRAMCRAAIESRFTPRAQRALIDNAVNRMIND